MRHIALALFLMLSAAVQSQESQQFSTYTIAWWNVENFFDTRDDPATNDEEFTPGGEKHWTRRRFNTKRNGIYKTLLRMGLPDVVGMAEVENKYVLRELCNATPLRKAGYRYVHYDSPDRRGIDCALLYRQDRFRVLTSRPINVSDSAEDFYTRDILLVEGVTPAGDTLIFLLNHWPSKRGGDEADAHRLEIAQRLRSLMDSLAASHPKAAILAMGDFNSTRDEEAIFDGMGFGDRKTNADGIRNLAASLPEKWGSHKFQGQWRYLDAMFLKADKTWNVGGIDLIRYRFLLTDDGNHPGQRPKRTHVGPRYEGGFSDHLPLLLRLSHPVQKGKE